MAPELGEALGGPSRRASRSSHTTEAAGKTIDLVKEARALEVCLKSFEGIGDLSSEQLSVYAQFSKSVGNSSSRVTSKSPLQFFPRQCTAARDPRLSVLVLTLTRN